MPKLRLLLFCCSAVLALSRSALADTVVLKTGEKIEGRILSENDAQVTVEVQVSASIKDERIIKKADIARVDKIKPDEVAWPAIKGLALGRDSFDAAEYQRAEGLLQKFLTEFPTSSHAAEAKAKLAEFSEEQKRVAKGEAKLDGKWLAKDEVDAEKVQLNGRVLYSRMARLAAAGQLVDAMNVFDALEKSYSGSSSMPEAIVLAQQVLPNLEKAAVQGRERIKSQADVNRRRIATAQGQEREQLQNMLKNEDAAANAAAESATKLGLKWMPLVAKEGILNTTASRAAGELSSLKSRPVEKMREAIAAADEAKKALADNDAAAADKAYNRAQSAWPNYELLKRLKPKLDDAKKEAAEAKVAADKAAAAAKIADAAKEKAEQEAKKVAAQKAIDAQNAAAAAAADNHKDDADSTPFYKKPILYVVLVLAGLFGTLGVKAYHKFRDPNRNLLDQ
jgi:hypothetical protein